MPATAKCFVAIGALALSALVAGGALAQNDGKKAAASPAPDKAGDGVARYCDSVAPLAAEARIAWQSRRLTELEGEIKQRIADLDAKEAEARDWVAKRAAMMNAASDEVAAIYAKMQPETAAGQLAEMDEPMAAAILGKLKANVAGAILDEMEAPKASKLTALMSGAAPAPAAASAPAAAAAPAEKKS
jgi:flagellar motility protein MotE (MotC chaperone)